MKTPLLAYRALMAHLKQLTPRLSYMRISLEPEQVPFNTAEPELVVVGRNGSRNRDLPDWHECGAPADLSEQEAIYSLSLIRWEEWLGMEVDTRTLRSLPAEKILAYILMDMTFYGFTQDCVAEVSRELRDRSDAFNALSPEERARVCKSAEEVIASLRRRLTTP